MNEIQKRVMDNIGASVVQVTSKPQSTWDGDGYTVLECFAVLWELPESEAPPNKPESRFGTHTGAISMYAGSVNRKVTIYWGHYGLTLEEAKESFVEKQSKL